MRKRKWHGTGSVSGHRDCDKRPSPSPFTLPSFTLGQTPSPNTRLLSCCCTRPLLLPRSATSLLTYSSFSCTLPPSLPPLPCVCHSSPRFSSLSVSSTSLTACEHRLTCHQDIQFCSVPASPALPPRLVIFLPCCGRCRWPAAHWLTGCPQTPALLTFRLPLFLFFSFFSFHH